MSLLAIRAVCIAACGSTLSWLLLSGNSPFAHWLAGRSDITNAASAVNLPTMLFALAGVPGTRPPTDGAIAMVAIGQWLAYGVVLAWLWHKLSPGGVSMPESPDDAG